MIFEEIQGNCCRVFSGDFNW